jgi:hypothetical protein
MRTRHNVMLYIHCLSFYIPVFYLLFMKVDYEQVVPVYGFIPYILIQYCWLRSGGRNFSAVIYSFCYSFPRRRRPGRDDSNLPASSAKG